MALVELNAKVALVTGGGTRVGAAISRALCEAGCDLILHYATNDKGARELATHAAKLGRRAVTLQADLYDRKQIDRLAREAIAAFGKLDILVHNAANFDRVPPDELSAEAWDKAMALNVTAPYLLSLALAPELRKAHGSIIAITCTSAQRPWKNFIPYSVSKAALAQLVRGLALGFAPEVRVNGVAPGTVMPPEHYDQATLERFRQKVPLERFGEADDVARAVVFLTQNDYISGQIFTVDGGRSLT